MNVKRYNTQQHRAQESTRSILHHMLDRLHTLAEHKSALLLVDTAFLIVFSALSAHILSTYNGEQKHAQ
jgi:hypothetical protein